MKTKEAFAGFDRLKQSVSMVQVLDRYGLTKQLHRSGDSLSGACPIHQGHNRTQFRVSLSRNCWICFGDCHGGGSIIDFVSRKEGIGIRDAARLIQDWFQVEPVNGKQVNGHSKAVNGTRAPSIPEREFNRPLRYALGPLDTDHTYLKYRGLNDETIHTFGVGFCTRGMFAGWIVIPIHDAAGRLVAHAGRWPGQPTNGQPKYRLPRGFRKSVELFNQHRAAKEDPSVPLVVVEGFFGSMRVWQAGHRRVVSLMGSMLSRRQEERIIELVGNSEVSLLLDEDEAGRKGSLDARLRLVRSVKVRVVRLGEAGMQPDQLSNERLLELIESHQKGVV